MLGYSVTLLIYVKFSWLLAKLSCARLIPKTYIVSTRIYFPWQNMKTWLLSKLKGKRYFHTKKKQQKTDFLNYKTLSIPKNSVKNKLFMGGRGLVVPYSMGRSLNTYTRLIPRNRSYPFLTKKQFQVPNGPLMLTELVKLKQRNKIQGVSWRNKDLFRLLRYTELWMIGYQKLLHNSESNGFCTSKLLIDDISLESLITLKESVLSGLFKWGELRRIYISKPNLKFKSLGIPVFQDKIVQKVIEIILEIIFEPELSEFTVGFQPKCSQLQTIRTICKNFEEITWFIKGDSLDYFDNINYKRLLSLIEKRVDDIKFLRLIQTGLKVYFPTKALENKKKKILEKNVLSPFFSNIYWKELDQWVAKYKTCFDKGTRVMSLLTGYKQFICKSAGVKINPMDNNFRRLHYVRYANTFLIGIIGGLNETQQVKVELNFFLKSHLNIQLNYEKIKILHWSNSVHFLGYIIGFRWITLKMMRASKVLQRRVLIIYADTRKVIKQLNTKKFCKKNGDPLPCFQFIHQTQTTTIRCIKSIIQRLFNYYRLARNRKRFINKIIFILKHSVAKMYAAKFKLKTCAAVFKRQRIEIEPKRTKYNKKYSLQKVG